MNNLVAIVGRPNVGKSTLFNRLLGYRQAIVDDEAGVTRDRQYGPSDWSGKKFTVVDTGGFVHGSDDIFEAAIRTQVRIAMEEAKVIVFLTDAHTGITAQDLEVAKLLRQSDKKILVAVNKVDNSQLLFDAAEFWNLGFDNLFFISAVSGSGTGELLDAVIEQIDPEEEDDSRYPKITVVGRPNAGKSTLVNTLLDEERHIVTDIAGTTRDAIHSHYSKFGHEFTLIDTAGVRKKSKVKEDLEFYSVMRAIKTIEEADVMILLVDATQGMEAQDVSLFNLAQKRNKGIIIVMNKWDLVEKSTNTIKELTEKIHSKIAPFTDVPILFISAQEKQRIHKLVELCMEVYENKHKTIPTSKLNSWLEEVLAAYSPPTYRGHMIKIKYGTQLKAKHPAFVFFCNHPTYIKDPYRNYLENKLRVSFDFKGVPISIFFREK